MASTTIIRTNNLNGSEILKLKHMFSRVTELDQHLVAVTETGAEAYAILESFFEKYFSGTQASNGRLYKSLIAKIDEDWYEISNNGTTIFEGANNSDSTEWESDYIFDSNPGYFKTTEQFRSQLDQVLVI